MCVSEVEIAHLMAEQENISTHSGNRVLETDAHSLAAQIALRKAYQKFGITHALSFHRSIKRAQNFADVFSNFTSEEDVSGMIKSYSISSKLSAGKRSRMLHEFTMDERAVISNARCLTEGVDIPAIDCVAFVDSKKSVVDIVQAAGRAMRTHEKKEFGYILLPLVVPTGATLEEFTSSTAFADVAKIITKLSMQDERIAEQLKNKAAGQPPTREDIIIADPDILDTLGVEYDYFYENISTQLWQSVAKGNWMSFEERRLCQILGWKAELDGVNT